MLTVGLTGGIGVGKTTVAQLFTKNSNVMYKEVINDNQTYKGLTQRKIEEARKKIINK